MTENETPKDVAAEPDAGEEILDDDLFLDEDEAPDGVVNPDGYLEVPTGAQAAASGPDEGGGA